MLRVEAGETAEFDLLRAKAHAMALKMLGCVEEPGETPEGFTDTTWAMSIMLTGLSIATAAALHVTKTSIDRYVEGLRLEHAAPREKDQVKH